MCNLKFNNTKHTSIIYNMFLLNFCWKISSFYRLPPQRYHFPTPFIVKKQLIIVHIIISYLNRAAKSQYDISAGLLPNITAIKQIKLIL